MSNRVPRRARTALVHRPCARRRDRWRIRSRDAGDDHDQAGRLQAARPRPDGQDARESYAAARSRLFADYPGAG
jgi:hypothetical protein